MNYTYREVVSKLRSIHDKAVQFDREAQIDCYGKGNAIVLRVLCCLTGYFLRVLKISKLLWNRKG